MGFFFKMLAATTIFGLNDELYFSVSPKDHTAIENAPVRLRCEAEPRNRIKYSWKIDGQPMAPSPRRHLLGGDLYITRVNRIFDSGEFVCVATDQVSGYYIESSSAKIIVQCEFVILYYILPLTGVSYVNCSLTLTSTKE